MNEQEYRQIRTLLADRKQLATFDLSTLSDDGRATLARGLLARGRLTDARRVKGH
jgi:hypothetical protein